MCLKKAIFTVYYPRKMCKIFSFAAKGGEIFFRTLSKFAQPCSMVVVT